MNATAVTRCRSCGGDRLEPVLDLGDLAVSDFPVGQDAPLDRAPLALVYCADCAMAQLSHSYDRDRLYKTAYWYRSSVNPVMVAALKDVVDEALRHVELYQGDPVLDLGCNDGALLDQYPKDGSAETFGIDPSPVVFEAEAKGHVCLRDYFPTGMWGDQAGQFKIITSIAQFYNVDNVNEYVAAIKDWLAPDGVWIVQFQDLWSMLRANAVDNVCHEHVTYPSRTSMAHLLRRHGLAIDTWSEHRINGGSLRLVVKHADKAREQAPAPEAEHGWRRALREFAAKTEANKHDVLGHLRARRALGQPVYGYAASTKANTLLQYYGIGPDLVTAFAERSPEKWGRYTVTGIPIVSEEEVRRAEPAALFLGAWQFADAFRRREAALVAGGTDLIVPLPRLDILRREEPSAA